MTAPRGGADQATTRGAIVLVVAVIIGLVLLSRSDGLVGSASEGSAKPSESTSTTAPVTSVDTVVPTATDSVPSQGVRPPAEVKVIVINASGQVGVASANNDKVAGAGFTTLEIKNGPPTPTTTIYFVDGYQADAEAVKVAVGLTAAPVQPAPDTPIIPEAAEANVMVVLGQDFQA